MPQASHAQSTPIPCFEVARIRQDFPMLQQPPDGKHFIYLVSAATGQKPQVLLDRLYDFYRKEYGKPDAEHTASQLATQMVEKTRELAAEFLHAPSAKEIVFVRGTTEAINLVANCFERAFLSAGDEV